MTEMLTPWTQPQQEAFVQTRRIVTRLQNAAKQDARGQVPYLIDASQAINYVHTPVETLIDHLPNELQLPIDYLDEGPHIYGVPVWKQLPDEPNQFYALFDKYLMSNEGSGKFRNLFDLSLSLNVPIAQLETVKQMYHWGLRAFLYDTQKELERQRAMEYSQRAVEGRHASLAEKLFNTGTEYLLNHADQLTPKIALQMVDMAAKLERLSCGLGDSRRSDSSPAVVVNNTVNAPVNETKTIVTGDLEDDKQRLMQVLNIMNTIGALNPDQEIIDAEEVES